jgi:hypothetical protein
MGGHCRDREERMCNVHCRDKQERVSIVGTGRTGKGWELDLQSLFGLL